VRGLQGAGRQNNGGESGPGESAGLRAGGRAGGNLAPIRWAAFSKLMKVTVDADWSRLTFDHRGPDAGVVPPNTLDILPHRTHT